MSRRLAQISDLHFGAEDQRLIEPLLASLRALRPHLVVVSGDLTQRATRVQFEAARAFVARLPAPAFAVPGNHDIPLINFVVRFVAGRSRWHRWLGLPWSPIWKDEEMIVASIDSPRAWRFVEGVVSREQLERVRAAFATAPDSSWRIVVAHHPLAPVQGLGEGHSLVLGARRARQALRDVGTDLVLSGHLHVSGRHDAAEATRKGLLFLQAPSALSHRLRGERNGFHVIDLEPGRIATTLMSFDAEARAFVAGATIEHATQDARG